MPECLVTPEHKTCDAIDGPISADEGAHLAYLASLIPAGGVVVEIGTNLGKSACFMGCGLRYARNLTARIHCVDLWSLGGPTQQFNYADPQGRRREMFKANREALGLSEILIDHEVESVTFAKTWIDPIDLLFIDAGHTYEALHADYEAWFRFVKPGGFIAFHDYMNMWPGVKKVLDEEVFPNPIWTDWQTVYRMKTARRA